MTDITRDDAIEAEDMTIDDETLKEILVLCRIDEIDRATDAITIPEGLSPEAVSGAKLVAQQLLDYISARKKKLRTLL